MASSTTSSDITANSFTGSLTGNVTGNVTGKLTGPVVFNNNTVSASAAINRTYGLHTLSGATSSVTMTVDAPVTGELQVFYCSDVTATGSLTVVLTAGTFDGTNGTATFNAAGETLVVVGVTATRYMIVENIGSVALS